MLGTCGFGTDNPSSRDEERATWALALDGEHQPPQHCVAVDSPTGPQTRMRGCRGHLGACAFTVLESVTRDADVSNVRRWLGWQVSDKSYSMNHKR